MQFYNLITKDKSHQQILSKLLKPSSSFLKMKNTIQKRRVQYASNIVVGAITNGRNSGHHALGFFLC